MNIEALHQFIASVPGSFGDAIGRRIAVNQIAAGSVNHAAALVGLAGLDVIPALVAAEAPPAMLRAAIQYAVLHEYRDLPGLDRAAFAGWCRQAEFTAPPGTPEVVSLYRGTMGCRPTIAARGWHWSFSLDDAAYYGCRFADAAMTGVIVVHARVPREGIAAFITGTAYSEVIPAEVPAEFETIIDHERIGDAAVRAARRFQELRAAGGWSDTGTAGIARQAAMAARARMTAAGVVPGTAIVA